MKSFFILTFIAIATFSWLAIADDTAPTIPVKESTPEQPIAPVTKTDAEWRAELTPEQYRILRQAGTEAPNGKVYKQFKEQGAGTYYCGGCGAELFSSDTKFDSACGWPSFYDPSNAKNVKTKTDYSLGMKRVEVLCAKCDGHLGHVFSGERFRSLGNKATPTNQRYCINGVALTFVPKKEVEETKEKKSKAE